MPLRPTAPLLADAAARGVGVGAFNLVNLETAQALVGAAESSGLPLILQISQNCVVYHQGRMGPLAKAVAQLAEESTATLALHLDHAEDADLTRAAVDLGFGSVMYDGAALPYEENVATTRAVVEYARAAGVMVEAELGEIGGKDGAHKPGVRTDPDQAFSFVQETGVDALAVAVGSTHAMTRRETVLDNGLIRDLRDSVPVPLVLHGSSGVPDCGLREAVRSGIVKVNVSTHLNGVFTGTVRERLGDDPRMVDPRKYLGPAREAMAAESARLLRVIAEQEVVAA